MVQTSPPQGFVASSVIPQELWYDVRDYGARGDGSTDDTTAIQNAINAAGAGLVYVPPATYRITSINPKAGGTIRGDGPGASILKLTTNGNTSMIAFPASADDVTIEGLKLDGNRLNETPGGQIHAITTNTNTNRCRLRNLSIVSPYDSCVALGSNNADIWIDSCYFSDIGRSAMYLSGARAYVRNNNITNPGARVGAAGIQLATLVDSVITGNYVTGGTDDSITLVTSSVRNMIFYNRLTAATLSGIETDTTSVDNEFDGNQSTSHTQHGMHISSRNYLRSNVCRLNGRAGIKLNGATPWSRGIVVGNACNDNGAAAAEQYGIELTGTVTDSVIMGNVCTDTGPATQVNGIAMFNSCDFITIVGNDVRQNTGTGIITANSNNVVTRNRGYNPIGVSAITVTASPFTYTNGDSLPEAVYISGGTISNISKNSVTIFTVAGDVTIWLEPGEAVTVTYTVAPTMNKDAK